MKVGTWKPSRLQRTGLAFPRGGEGEEGSWAGCLPALGLLASCPAGHIYISGEKKTIGK